MLRQRKRKTTQMGDDGKAEWPLSPGVQVYGDFSSSLPGSQQLWEVAEGLWWLVAWRGPLSWR